MTHFFQRPESLKSLLLDMINQFVSETFDCTNHQVSISDQLVTEPADYRKGRFVLSDTTEALKFKTHVATLEKPVF